jgi:hypothetical protein
MTFENLISDVCDKFPAVQKEYDLQKKNGDMDASLGQHIFFSFVFDKILFKAIDSGNSKLAAHMFDYLEEMEKSGDTNVAEVCEFTVLEELCDNYCDADFEKYLSPETKLALQAIRKYIPES